VEKNERMRGFCVCVGGGGGDGDYGGAGRWPGLERKNCNAVSLDERSKILYRAIQRLVVGAQLAGRVSHYFPK
jgi:hypothetical protein